MNYCLLGTHPANHSYSVVRYFNFYRHNLPAFLGAPLTALCPGGVLPSDDILPSLSRREIWRQNYIEWPLKLLRSKSDLAHFVDHGLLWSAPFLRGGVRLATVHDLINHMSALGHLTLTAAPAKQKFLVLESMRQLKRMDHIVSVSQSTADCIMREVGIPAGKISVIPNHVDSKFTPASSAKERLAFRARCFGDASKVVIHVGQPTRYKNRMGAIRSFALLRERITEARLFLIGGPPAAEELQLLTERGWGPFVTFVSSVSLAGLREIYASADVLVFPSLYEGFGWPPLEAMACGCPVVSSTRGSLGEVVGDAALTTDDPYDYQFIASALYDVLSDSGVADQLRAAGMARARMFSGDRCLAAMADVYGRLG